jgi:hypothetical protein
MRVSMTRRRSLVIAVLTVAAGLALIVVTGGQYAKGRAIAAADKHERRILAFKQEAKPRDPC